MFINLGMTRKTGKKIIAWSAAVAVMAAVVYMLVLAHAKYVTKKMETILVISGTVTDKTNLRTFTDLTKPNQKEYCDKQGYGYKFVEATKTSFTGTISSCIAHKERLGFQVNEGNETILDVKDELGYWLKIHLLVLELKKKRTDVQAYVWVDDDAVFLTDEPYMSDLLQELVSKDKHIGIGEDREHSAYVNSGFLLVRNTPEALQFLNAVNTWGDMERRGDLPSTCSDPVIPKWLKRCKQNHDCLHEQQAIAELLKWDATKQDPVVWFDDTSPWLKTTDKGKQLMDQLAINAKNAKRLMKVYPYSDGYNILHGKPMPMWSKEQIIRTPRMIQASGIKNNAERRRVIQALLNWKKTKSSTQMPQGLKCAIGLAANCQ